jgi:FkbM family methyltransferase
MPQIDSNNGLFFRNNTWDIDIFNSITIADEYGFFLPDDFRLQWEGDFIDVGCHIGSVSHLMYTHGKAKHIYAIEPDPGNFAMSYINLYPGISESKITLFNRCIAASRDTLCCGSYPAVGFNITADKEINKKINTGGGAWHHKKNWPELYTQRSIHIDDVITMCHTGSVLLKLDCEGCEYTIFKNSEKLNMVDYIFGEFHGCPEEFKQILIDTSKKWNYDYTIDTTIDDAMGYFTLKRQTK